MQVHYGSIRSSLLQVLTDRIYTPCPVLLVNITRKIFFSYVSKFQHTRDTVCQNVFPKNKICPTEAPSTTIAPLTFVVVILMQKLSVHRIMCALEELKPKLNISNKNCSRAWKHYFHYYREYLHSNRVLETNVSKAWFDLLGDFAQSMCTNASMQWVSVSSGT